MAEADELLGLVWRRVRRRMLYSPVLFPLEPDLTPGGYPRPALEPTGLSYRGPKLPVNLGALAAGLAGGRLAQSRAGLQPQSRAQPSVPASQQSSAAQRAMYRVASAQAKAPASGGRSLSRLAVAAPYEWGESPPGSAAAALRPPAGPQAAGRRQRSQPSLGAGPRQNGTASQTPLWAQPLPPLPPPNDVGGLPAGGYAHSGAPGRAGRGGGGQGVAGVNQPRVNGVGGGAVFGGAPGFYTSSAHFNHVGNPPSKKTKPLNSFAGT